MITTPNTPPQDFIVLKLHGFTVSNYFNMVKMALIEKGIDFEFVDVRPNQEGNFLAKSPMGKVPCLETDDGFISETNVIFEYLEDLGQGVALFALNLRRVVSCDAKASRLPNTLSESKNSHITVNTIYEYMT